MLEREVGGPEDSWEGFKWAMAEHSRCSDESKREKKPGRMALLDQKTCTLAGCGVKLEMRCLGGR